MEITALWVRLLSILPSNDGNTRSGWVSSGLILMLSPPTTVGHRTITAVVFEPPYTYWDLVHRLFESDDWEDVLHDPFLLFAMYFEAWYLFVDENAWTILDNVTETETASHLNFRTSSDVSPS